MSMQFRAMNTDIRVVLPQVHPLQQESIGCKVERVFATTEQRFSRFLPDSELSRLNSSRGPVVVSPELFEAFQRARFYWELTDGWFDVTIGRALCEAGYDRSFAPGALDRKAGRLRAQPHSPARDTLVLEPSTRTVELRNGAAIDCGGFIKGWAVDRAAESLPTPSAVDAGGDAALRGDGPGGDGWCVNIEDPQHRGHVVHSLRVRNQAVATSGANRRHWRMGTSHAHHLIDPRTGLPAVSDLVQATVVAASCELADVLAKTVFLRGSLEGRRFLRRFPGVSAVLVLRGGGIQLHGEVTQ